MPSIYHTGRFRQAHTNTGLQERPKYFTSNFRIFVYTGNMTLVASRPNQAHGLYARPVALSVLLLVKPLV